MAMATMGMTMGKTPYFTVSIREEHNAIIGECEFAICVWLYIHIDGIVDGLDMNLSRQ